MSQLLCAAITAVLLAPPCLVLSQTTPLFPVACELNILVVLDRSDSVKGGFNKPRNFVLDVSQELQIGPEKHRVAMIVYSGPTYRREVFKWNFAKNNEEFHQILSSLKVIGGTTSTKRALEIANNLMETRDQTVATLMMVLTDGRSADDPKQPAIKLRSYPNTWLFAASTGDPEKVDMTELMDITGDENKIVTHRGRELATDIAKRILRKHTENGLGSREVPYNNDNHYYNHHYYHNNHDYHHYYHNNLVFVMDLSTTTSHIYSFYKEMAEKIVKALIISPRHTRVALVGFSSIGRTRTVFNLKKFKWSDQVIPAIAELQSAGGLTAIGTGIQEAMKQGEKLEGARPDLATKVMVIFTDGWNNKGPDPEMAAKEAHAKGWELFAVGYASKKFNGEDVPLHEVTLNVLGTDETHIYSDQNTDQMIERIRERNAKCFEEPL